MLYSMTGYANELVVVGELTYNLELRVLNSKNFDAMIRMGNSVRPFEAMAQFRPFEAMTRKLLTEILSRGKADLNIELYKPTAIATEKTLKFNQELFEQLLQTVQTVKLKYEINTKDIFTTILNKCISEVPYSENFDKENIKQQTWTELKQGIEKLLEKVNLFRLTEGKNIEQSIINCLDIVINAIAQIRQLAPNRLAEIKTTLQNKIETLVIDTNSYRLEQELFFYAERLDIAEELQRIDAHMQYFTKVLADDNNKIKGKKLNFILQELIREFNTLGVKSQCALVQKEVINAKEQLEQIKEQLYNVL